MEDVNVQNYEVNKEGLIYDWNTVKKKRMRKNLKIQFDDETLRDGLQSPAVLSPKIDEKIKILHLMDELGIDTADIGLPGAGKMVQDDVYQLAKEIVDSKLRITPNCASRTLEQDIIPIAEISQKAGIAIEACLFIGSSPIRRYAEGWKVEDMVELTERTVKFAVKHNLPVMYVTEDTTRAEPETMEKLYLKAIESGAKRICICDTVGHSTPDGARNVIKFAKKIVKKSGAKVGVDWHGHSDRGLSVINTISAIEAGAERVHGCALGIGERVGNTPMDTLLVNLKLLGWIKNDLTKLREYCELVSKACGVPIPHNYPVFGSDAFETATGVHAAAVIKSIKKSDLWLTDRVYSGVPASDFGLKQKIRVGPMSGKSNVIYWLSSRNIEPDEKLVDTIFDFAKNSNRLLTDDEVFEIVKKFKT